MKASYFKIIFIAAIPLLFLEHATAQAPANIREFEKPYATYPFSDPDPVPNPGKIYPYFRYDGFTDQSVQKKWKVVELENDYIKVDIMPEIGGKIWTAIDKQTGKPFIYENGVVKFRNIAMRGPWTSGGIEANFGIIGHTPTVANPVDYMTRKNSDGSVSCIIGALDLLARTRWNMEIRLPKDKAYFITQVYWHNETPIEQPYYSWMNLAVKTRDSLQFIDPGTHYIGHDGSVHLWPFDSLGHNLSIYDQNNFGGSKSYHIMGTYSKYFGAYWKQENSGMIHYAEREDKPGKKVFMWALSGQGKIWEDLLTDNSGQYCEIQSGRLFNQNMISSSLTPFKQVGFAPYNADVWTEYWYPYKNTDGVASADMNGAINVHQGADSLTVLISPVSAIKDTLKLFDETGKIVYRQSLDLKPFQAYQKNFKGTAGKDFARLELAGSVLDWKADSSRQLSRPLQPFPGFDWGSAYGLYLMGRDLARYRNYEGAEKKIRASLAKEPAFMPALTEMSLLQYRKMHYDSAFYYARQALSIDTYDPASNYYYGLAAEKLGKWYDALDGFEIAALTPNYRAAAFTALSGMYLQKADYTKASEYASRSLDFDDKNMSALKLKYLAGRLTGNKAGEQSLEQKILALAPLNHFIRFENYWEKRDQKSREEFTGLIRNELPQETYLELAVWYFKMNRQEESKAILAMTPASDVVLYWQAYLHKDDADAQKWLDAANGGNPLMAFPFREETATVMEWAAQQTSDWKPQYYLALIQSFRNNKTAALKLLSGIQGKVDFAPFYITRAALYDSSETVKRSEDLQKAISLDKKEWRYGKYFTEFLLAQKEYAQALETIQPYYKEDANNYITGMLYTRCLMLNNQYKLAEKVLNGLDVLPFEGATDGHQLYRQTKLMLALRLLEKHQYKAAIQKVSEAREWPENLGVGKPYPNLINNDIENGIENLIKQSMHGAKLPAKDIGLFEQKVKAISQS